MKRVVIVHCWAGVPDSRWYPYVKSELEKIGEYEVLIPEMPNTDHPEPAPWLAKLTETVGGRDADLVLVGHSVGVPTILRYVEQLPEGVQIAGLISVAGYTDSLNDVTSIEDKSVLPPFFDPPLDYKKIKSHCKNFVWIYSDNDPYVAPKYALILQEKLGGELIEKKGMGHFSEPDGDGDRVIVKELPEVVEAVKKMSNG